MIYKEDINYIVNKIGQELDLSKNKVKQIEDSYVAISNYINNNHEDSNDTDFRVYTTGSYSTRTVVKPIKKDDFDIDMIIEFLNEEYSTRENASRFYEKLLEIFKGDSRYSDKVEESDHCVTIKYENGYHIDIIPARPIEENRIQIPNKKRNKWVERRPKLYSKWFNEVSDKKIKFVYMNENALIKDALFAKDRAIDIEDLENSDFTEVNVLNRAVQLIKRARDVYFNEKKITERIPQSIIFTTLCAENYKGEYDLLELLKKFSEIFLSLSRSQLKLQNPVNKSEWFTEKWSSKPEYQNNFVAFSRFFFNQIKNVFDSSDRNVIVSSLNNLFGTGIYSEVKTYMIENSINNAFFETRPKDKIKFKNSPIDFNNRKGRGSSN